MQMLLPSLVAFASVFSLPALAHVDAIQSVNAAALIGQELVIEVLPDGTKFTQAQEEHLQAVGYLVVRPTQYAANGLLNWLKGLSSSPAKQEKPRAERHREYREERRERREVRRESHHARVVSVENEAASSGEHSFSGLASYYGGRHSIKYNKDGGYTAAHRSLPFGTRVRVTHDGKSVIVIINDRGPFIRGRVIDIDTGAARAIGLVGVGVGRVTCEVM